MVHSKHTNEVEEEADTFDQINGGNIIQWMSKDMIVVVAASINSEQARQSKIIPAVASYTEHSSPTFNDDVHLINFYGFEAQPAPPPKDCVNKHKAGGLTSGGG